MIRKSSDRVRPLVGRASVPHAGERMPAVCPVHPTHPERFTDSRLRGSQRSVTGCPDVMARKLVHAASGESPLSCQPARPGQTLGHPPESFSVTSRRSCGRRLGRMYRWPRAITLTCRGHNSRARQYGTAAVRHRRVTTIVVVVIYICIYYYYINGHFQVPIGLFGQKERRRHSPVALALGRSL